MWVLRWLFTRVVNALAEVLEEEYRRSFHYQFQKNSIEIRSGIEKLQEVNRQAAKQVLAEERSRQHAYNQPTCLN